MALLPDKPTTRWVVKIGSSLLTNDGKGLHISAIEGWARQIAELWHQGHEVLLVSSGAVAAGLVRLGLHARPSELHKLQAVAAVGQMGLVQCYETAFYAHGLSSAQILLTHDDLSNRKRYLNARSTLFELLSMNVVPIINENDTVVTDEIRFGDNDTLAALVANLVEADQLVILTDQDGLCDKDPTVDSSAQLIKLERANNPELLKLASPNPGSMGRGGMYTKVKAAGLAARSGARTIIASGRQDRVLLRLGSGERLGTCLEPDAEPWAARKQWLAGHLQMKGVLVIDEGAASVLANAGSSLLPVGVVAVSGGFQRGEMVECRTVKGDRIACGLVNYSSVEADKIKGRGRHCLIELLGYLGEEELIHRDNMIIFDE